MTAKKQGVFTYTEIVVFLSGISAFIELKQRAAGKEHVFTTAYYFILFEIYSLAQKTSLTLTN